MNSTQILIERRNGVSIYARKLDARGRLGQFSVISDYLGNNGVVYSLLSDAQIRMAALIGVQKP